MAQQLLGKVISTKMNKTVVVSVERKFRHPKYHKVLIRHKKYKAHNEVAGIAEGDMVAIEQTRPVSKDTKFAVMKKIT